jgi:hypothetical protein
MTSPIGCAPSYPNTLEQSPASRHTLTDTRDLIRLLIRDLYGKLLFDGHDDLYGIEAVQAEVLGEGCCRGELEEGETLVLRLGLCRGIRHPMFHPPDA